MERKNKTQQASSLIDDLNIPGRPERPRKPSTYDYLKQTNPEHRLVVEYEAALKVFNDYWDSIPSPEPKTKPEPLKKLVDVDIKSCYELFKKMFLEVTAVPFDHEENNGESKILVYTLLYYFFRDKRFLDSPLINKEINQTDLQKGILVIGGYGCGKTSVFKTIRQMFFDAQRNRDVKVLDVDGDEVSLCRYRRSFGYYTANEVVRIYEEAVNPEMKDRFWKIMTKGLVYYDDLMTEREASNYGKVEIFKDILEERYDKKSLTLASCNYVENTQKTMEALGQKYGSRVYDRLFEMFNIIELKGKSLRK